MKTIYNVYVTIESQWQADRMKQLCIDNGLPIWNNPSGWIYYNDEACLFAYDKDTDQFFVFISFIWVKEWEYTQVTEQEFIELLKEKL